MKFQNILVFLTVLSLFAACKNDTAKNPEVIKIDTEKQTGSDLDKTTRTDVTFIDNRITTAFKLYNTVRAALVNTNSEDAAQYADILYRSEIMQDADAETKKALQLIMDGKDIEEQRKHFVTVTKAVEKLVDGNVTSGALYKQYCPMAFGNTGAYWLSDSKEIRNPYFGDKMLKCGRIDAEIK